MMPPGVIQLPLARRAGGWPVWVVLLLCSGCGLQLQGLGSDEPYQLHLHKDTGGVPHDTVQTLNALLPFEADAGAQTPLATVRLLKQSVRRSTLATGGGARQAEQRVGLTLRYELLIPLPDATGQVSGTQHQCQRSDNHPVDEIRSLATGTRRTALIQQLVRACAVQMRYQVQQQLEKMKQNNETGGTEEAKEQP